MPATSRTEAERGRRLGRLALQTVGVAAILALAACGGGGGEGDSAAAGEEPAPIDPSELVDVSTIDETEAEAWARAADTWADGALDDANTVGELLGVERTQKRLLNGKALQVRARIEDALLGLADRCLASVDQLPPPPTEFAEADQSVELACERFTRASKQLRASLEQSSQKKMKRGLSQLAQGVNAIAAMYETISPSLR